MATLGDEDFLSIRTRPTQEYVSRIDNLAKTYAQSSDYDIATIANICMLLGYYKTISNDDMCRELDARVNTNPVLSKILSGVCEFEFENKTYETLANCAILFTRGYNLDPKTSIRVLIALLSLTQSNDDSKYIIMKCLSTIKSADLDDDYKEILSDTIWMLANDNTQPTPAPPSTPEPAPPQVDAKKTLLQNTPLYVADFTKTLTGIIIDSATLSSSDDLMPTLKSHFNSLSNLFSTIANDIH